MNSGIGNRLREARTERGIELEDAEQQIRIRKRFLVAMEEERWEVLPGAAYVRGFLHTYAEMLGLDADAVVDEYRRAQRAEQGEGGAAEPEPTPQLAIAEQPPRRLGPRGLDRVPPGRWVALTAAIAAVLVFLLVLGLTGGSDDEGGGEPQRAEPQQPAPASAPGKEPEEEPAKVKLELATAADVWVCLLNEGGEPVIAGVTLPAGTSEGPFRSPRFDITLGNGQVELAANGEAVEIPAPAEPVGFRITPERTRELSEDERPTCT